MNPSHRALASTPAVALALTFGLVACGDTDEPTISDVTEAVTEASEAVDDAIDETDAASADLAQALRDNGLDTLASALETIDIDQLIDVEDYTLLAPDDDAFLGMGAEQTADLLSDPSMILDVLRNHVVAEPLTAEQLEAAGTVETENGTSLTVTVEGDTVMIGDATVVRADIEVGSSVVHVVDAVLVP